MWCRYFTYITSYSRNLCDFSTLTRNPKYFFLFLSNRWANLWAMVMTFIKPMENGLLLNCFKFDVHKLVRLPVINDICQIFNPNPKPNIFSAFHTIDRLAFEQWSWNWQRLRRTCLCWTDFNLASICLLLRELFTNSFILNCEIWYY